MVQDRKGVALVWEAARERKSHKRLINEHTVFLPCRGSSKATRMTMNPGSAGYSVRDTTVPPGSTPGLPEVVLTPPLTGHNWSLSASCSALGPTHSLTTAWSSLWPPCLQLYVRWLNVGKG